MILAVMFFGLIFGLIASKLGSIQTYNTVGLVISNFAMISTVGLVVLIALQIGWWTVLAFVGFSLIAGFMMARENIRFWAMHPKPVGVIAICCFLISLVDEIQ